MLGCAVRMHVNLLVKKKKQNNETSGSTVPLRSSSVVCCTNHYLISLNLNILKSHIVVCDV